jgi:hypothetical protein
LLHYRYPLGGVNITVQVMTFAQMSAKDKDPVVAVLECLYHIKRVNTAGTHGSDDANGGRILKA